MMNRYKDVIVLRKTHPALRIEDFHILYAEKQEVAYWRGLAGEEVLVIFNAANYPVQVRLPAVHLQHSCYQSVFPGGKTDSKVEHHALDVSLEAQSALVLVGK